MFQTPKLPLEPAGVAGANRAPLAAAGCGVPSDASVRSPARARLELVDATWRRGGRQPAARWSPRATLALSGGVALLLWGAIGLAIYSLPR